MGLKEFWKFMITDPAKQKKQVQATSPATQPTKPKTVLSSTQKAPNVPIQPELGIKESTAKRKLTKPVILFILINSILGSSLNIIVEDGGLVLGIWQGIYFCEFDGPRSREVYVKVIKGGEQ